MRKNRARQAIQAELGGRPSPSPPKSKRRGLGNSSPRASSFGSSSLSPTKRTSTQRNRRGNDTAAEELNRLCRDFVDSPARREMFSRLLGVHSVILMVEGTEHEANQNTQEMIAQALPQVERSLEFLPKPIKEPPHVIHLSAETAANERVLLWALGLNPEPTAATQVALIFGRGRKLGPVLRFPEDPRRRFIQSLAVVGQDCECGLDRRWMQGAMVPHRWSAVEEKKAIETGIADLKKSLEGTDIDDIKKKTQNLIQVSMKLGEAVYKSQQKDQTKSADPKKDKKDVDGNDKENVVDADFEDVKEDKEKSA